VVKAWTLLVVAVALVGCKRASVTEPVDAVAAELDDACMRRGLASCLDAGRRYEQGLTSEGRDGPEATPHTVSRIVATYYRGCVIGQAEACTRLAAFVAERDDAVAPHRRRLARVLEHACGSAYPRHPGACLAAGLHARACDLGSGASCGALAALRDGRTLGAAGLGSTSATALHARACERGWAPSCERVALALLAGGSARDPQRAAQLLQSACASGTVRACLLLADRYARGDGVVIDLAKARKLRAAACEAEDAEGCLRVARMERRGLGGDRRPVVAMAHLRKACELEEPAACETLGDANLRGEGVEEDQLAAFELYQRASRGYEARCDAGLVEACAALGRRLRLSGTGPSDEARGRELQRQACESGSAAGCLGVMSRGRFFLPGKGEVVGGHALGRRCRQGHADACLLLARIGKRGLGFVGAPDGDALLSHACHLGSAAACNAAGVSRFPPRPAGAAMLRRGCEMGDALACHHLGLVFELPAADQPVERAVALHRRACGWGYARACTRLGSLRASGGERGANPRAAASLFDRACRLGDRAGCFRLGEMWLEGTRVAPRRVDGRSLLERACHQGEQAACGRLGAWLVSGRHVELDRPTGEKLLRGACDEGEPRACATLAEVTDGASDSMARLERATSRANASCRDGIALCYDGTPSSVSAVWATFDGHPARRLLGVAACDAELERTCGDASDVAATRCEATGRGCFEAAALIDRVRSVGLAASKKRQQAMEERGVEGQRRACDAGDAAACGDVAAAHERGRGAKRDAFRAKSYRRRACRLDPTRCVND
jgi:uncharacterized protein